MKGTQTPLICIVLHRLLLPLAMRNQTLPSNVLFSIEEYLNYLPEHAP